MNNSPLTLTDRRGFTLLEVLVAVMVMGLTLTVLLQQFSVALRAGARSRDITCAVMHAREKLEELKLEKQLSESSESGRFDDGYTWETRVTPYEYTVQEGEETFFDNLNYDTFTLQAAVSWKSGVRTREITLQTLKTIKKEK